jgi:hypothetical protein
MRMLLKVSLHDTQEGNIAINDGRIVSMVEEFNNEMKPETAFFHTDDEGNRTMNFIFDMKETSQIPAIAETFFCGLNAKVHLYPVMNIDDLQRGMKAWSHKYKRQENSGTSRQLS